MFRKDDKARRGSQDPFVVDPRTHYLHGAYAGLDRPECVKENETPRLKFTVCYRGTG